MVLEKTVRNDLVELISRGRKIEAIKRLRGVTNLGIAEANRVVDQVESIGPSVLDGPIRGSSGDLMVGSPFSLQDSNERTRTMIYKGMSLFDLPVFQGPVDYVTGEERQKLVDKQSQRRWDYFIRTSSGDIERYCADDLYEAQSEYRRAVEAKKKAMVPFWVLLVLGIILLPAFGFGLLLLLIALLKFLPRALKLGKVAKKAEQKIQQVRQIIEDLARQIPTDTPSDEEMRQFVSGRLKVLEDKARKNLRLDTGEVTVEAEIPPIYEWGGLQDEEKPGFESIDRECGLHHKLVRITEDGTPIYAVYYVQYLFPTKDYIAVHGEFMDVIQDVTKGRLTDEYYYADVTSVRTEMRERQMFFLGNRHEECTTLRLTVASGDAVEVSMFDENLQRTLNQYIEDQQRARAEHFQALQDKLSQASGEDQEAVRVELEKAKRSRARLQEEDRASIANQVVRDIRHQLRVRKGTQTDN